MPLATSAATTSAPPLLAVPVEETTLFPEGDGFFEKRARAARRKVLDALAPVLARGLESGERVRYLAVGVRYSFWESWFARAAAEHHNRTALVVTDRRLLLLQVTTRNKPADLKAQVRLGRIRRAGQRTLGGWRLELADGTGLAFTRIPKKDRAQLEKLLLELPAAAAAAPGWSAAPVAPPSGAARWSGAAGTSALEHLCPACLAVVPGPVGAVLTCPAEACRIPFRDPRRAARLSAAIPGLGDLYLRHHLFGAMEFIGSMALLGIGVGWALGAFRAGGAEELGVALALAGLLLVVPRVIDWRLTLFMGRKGIVPLAEKPAPGAQARNLPSFPRWSPLLFLGGLGLALFVGWAMVQASEATAAAREVERLAQAGKLDEARERFRGLEAKGGLGTTERVRVALAFLEAGDLESSDELQGGWKDDAKVEQDVADRWNAAIQREQAALRRWRKGIDAFSQGDPEAAFAELDPAFAYFQGVRRPHFPTSRDEFHAHVAGDALAEPLRPQDVENARAWLGRAGNAPAPEQALVRAALASVRGDSREARASLEAAGGPAPSPGFEALRLETRARLAAGSGDAAEARAVSDAARGLLARDPKQAERARLERLAGTGR
jgi:hypothetical protein